MIKTFCEQPFALQDSHVVQHVETRLLSQYAIRPCSPHVHTLARCCTPLLNARTGLQGKLTYILTLAFAAPGHFKVVITALLAATHHPLPPHPLVPHIPILCPTPSIQWYHCPSLVIPGLQPIDYLLPRVRVAEQSISRYMVHVSSLLVQSRVLYNL
jgi:hypothetical protein